MGCQARKLCIFLQAGIIYVPVAMTVIRLPFALRSPNTTLADSQKQPPIEV